VHFLVCITSLIQFYYSKPLQLFIHNNRMYFMLLGNMICFLQNIRARISGQPLSCILIMRLMVNAFLLPHILFNLLSWCLRTATSCSCFCIVTHILLEICLLAIGVYINSYEFHTSSYTRARAHTHTHTHTHTHILATKLLNFPFKTGK
jgi:hypothetical protein